LRNLPLDYPDQPAAASAISQIAQNLIIQGKTVQEREAQETDPAKRAAVHEEVTRLFRLSARVFALIRARYPNDKLASRTAVLAAQCRMRAGDTDMALALFRDLTKALDPEDENIPVCMYWAGDCYVRKQSYVNANWEFNHLIEWYPDSQWAKFARGRLTDEKLKAVN
jgi:hypothetical protein